MKLQTNQTYSQFLTEVIPRTIGWENAFRGVTHFYDDQLSRIGDRLDCPFPEHHRNGGGHDAFHFFDDFNDTGMGRCFGDKVYGPLELLQKAPDIGGFSEVLRKLGQLVEHDISEPSTLPPTESRENFLTRANTPEKKTHRAKRLGAIGKGCIPITSEDPKSEPIKAYFRNRGIPIDDVVPDCLKFHQSLPAYEKVNGKNTLKGKFPAGIAGMYSPDGHLFTFHRIFTTLDGNKPAELKNNRHVMPEVERGRWLMNGGVFPLYTNDESTVIHLVEGVEKGHALRLILGDGVTIWACYCAEQLANFVPPAWCNSVHIWADYDPYFEQSNHPSKGMMGLWCGIKLQERLRESKITAKLHLPYVVDFLSKKWDWEDVIVKYGLLTLPADQQMTLLMHYFASDAVVNDLRKLMAF